MKNYFHCRFAILSMRSVRKVTVVCLAVFWGAVCAAQPQADVVPGRLIVKFKPAAYERAVQVQPLMRTQGVTAAKTLSVGLTGVDKLNAQHKAVSMYRLFPYAGKHEVMQQKFGLHLWYAIVLDESFAPRDVAEKYLKDADIEWAEPMPVVQSIHNESAFDEVSHITPTAALFPDDALFGAQWHYNNTGITGGTPGMDIRLLQAWNTTKGDPKVIVAVVDGGVDYTHPDLQANMWKNPGEIADNGIDDDDNGYIDDVYGFNFTEGSGFDPTAHPYGPVPNGPAPITASNHGTHVAGTIAAATNNSVGVAGIAGGDGINQGARLMSCQILNDEPIAAYTEAAIAYAANNGAVILQNSWKHSGAPSESVRTAIRYFIAAAGNTDASSMIPRPDTPMSGGIVIFAAGNDDTSTPTYPAAYDEVLAVAAINHYGSRAYYSNYGDWVNISAPGGDMQEISKGGVASTYPDNKYVYLQGTSMACPHVSGVAALVLSRYGSETYTPDMLRARLLSTVAPMSGDDYSSGHMGAGLVNATDAATPGDISTATITTIPAQTYNGAKIKPALTVTCEENSLTENVDYTATYINNVDAGPATVTITGISYYEGTKQASFTIAPMTVTVTELKAENKTYDGTAAATLTLGDTFKNKLVAADRDGITVNYPTAGTFTYIQVGTGTSVLYTGEVTLSEGKAANYKVIQQQTGLNANITPKSLQDPSISIQPVASAHTYTGSSVTPSLIVVDAAISSSTLTLGTDYTVRTQYPYIDVGAATITIAGTGNYSNTETISAPFTIVQKPITITELTAENKTYDGNDIATIKFDELEFKKKLAPDDRDVITITRPFSGTFTQSDVGTNIPVNAATVTLGTPKATNYAVTQQTGLKANITQKTLTDSDLTIATVADQPYTGEAIEPLLTVTEGANTLTLMQDYTVSYADKVDAGTASATVTITNIGNYDGGASASTTFTILKKAITVEELKAKDKTYDGTDVATIEFYESTFKSKLVSADKDVITVTAPTSGTFVQSNVGTNITVNAATVTLVGDKATNYTVEQQAVLKADITPKAITASDLTVVSAAPQTFTGLPCTTTVEVTFGETTLIEGTDYTIDGYDNNINAGVETATVTIRGAGNYDANTTKDILFTIHPMTVTVEELTAENKTYDGTAAATLTLGDTFKNKLVAADRDGITVDYPTAGTFTYVGVGTGTSVLYSGEVTLREGNAANYEIIQQETELTANITPKSLQDPSISIQPVPNQFYTGSSVTPPLIVVDAAISSSTLTLGSDYTVRTQYPYVDVGAATITIAGTGNYSNEKTIAAAFTILQKSITVTELTARDKTFDGNDIATIKFDELEFKKKLAPADKDVITVTAPSSGTFVQPNVGTGIKVTAATVTLSGDKAKNYAVTQQDILTADITQKTLTDSNLAIAHVDDEPYTGEAIKPLLTVTEDGNTLRPVLDYTVSYADSIDAGTASATVTITTTGNYTGVASAATTFTILKKAVKVEELMAEDKTYDGTTAAALTFDRPAFESKLIAVDLPFLTITEPTSGTFAQSDKGTDIEVTAADVEMDGDKAKNYTVEQQTGLKADITQKYLEASDFSIAPVSSYTYTGMDIRPSVVVTEGANTLTLQDYAVSYTNNKNAGAATITVTITGTGNYSGNASTFTTFLIMPKDINETDIATVPDQTYTGGAITPALTVTDGATALALGTDYTVAYEDNMEIGTAAATITGINNYTNTRQLSFKIIQKSITDGDITIEPIPAQTYTGEAFTPPLTVINGTVTLNESTDYTTTYADNINAGMATVTVTGTGNYSGSTITTFEILKADQTITFADIPPLWLINGPYTLEATATSGFTVTYTSSDPSIADIGSDGVTLQVKELGAATITASQEGDSNHNPAPPVQKQVIVEESGKVGVLRVIVEGATWDAVNDRYLVNCNDDPVIVTVEPEDYTARVYYNNKLENPFTVEIPVGTHRITYKVESGTNTQEYTIDMAKSFRFNDVVQMRWNNTLTVINNPANNGGFHFTSFTWYGNGRLITTKQSFSAGNTGQSIDPEIIYHVALTAEEYTGTLNTCPSAVALRQHTLEMVAYPNPAQSNGFIFVEINMDEDQLDHAEIEIINIVGSSMGKVRVAGRITPINTSALPTGIYLLNLRGKNDLNKIVKVLVQ